MDDYVRSALWAGVSLAEIRRETGWTRREIEVFRDELFAPFADTEAVKAAANGPLISAHSINRPKARRQQRPPRAKQIDMFAA